MKSFLFLVLLFLPFYGFADFQNSGRANPLGNTAWDQSHLYIVKMNLSSLALKTVSLQGERIVGKKTTVAFGLRFTPTSKLPFRSSILTFTEEQEGNDEQDMEARTIIEDARINGLALTPEFRYYFGKKAGRGLYIGPFLRYDNMGIKTTYLLEDNGVTTPLRFGGRLSSFGIGFIVGAQFKLSNRFVLDWWILGPYYTSNSLKMYANNLDLNDEEQQTARETINDAELAWFKTSSIVTKSDVQLKVTGSFAAVRGFGLCLGFKL